MHTTHISHPSRATHLWGHLTHSSGGGLSVGSDGSDRGGWGIAVHACRWLDGGREYRMRYESCVHMTLDGESQRESIGLMQEFYCVTAIHLPKI